MVEDIKNAQTIIISDLLMRQMNSKPYLQRD